MRQKTVIVAGLCLAVIGPILGHCLFGTFLGTIGFPVLLLTPFFLICGIFSRQIERRDPIYQIRDCEEGWDVAQEWSRAIAIPAPLRQELEEVIPLIDRSDISSPQPEASAISDRLDTIDCSRPFMVFKLKDTPDLEFWIEHNGHSQGERLSHCYRNHVFAEAICREAEYTDLFVSPMKPVYLDRERVILARRVVKEGSKEQGSIETALRQLVRFLLQTGKVGANFFSDPFSWVAEEGGKIALDKVSHLTERPYPFPMARVQQTRFIEGESDSLSSSLSDRPDLVAIVKDEFANCEQLLAPFG